MKKIISKNGSFKIKRKELYSPTLNIFNQDGIADDTEFDQIYSPKVPIKSK